MRQAVSPQKPVANHNAESLESNQSEGMKKRKFFEEYSGDTTPFDVQTESEEKEDVFAGAGVSQYFDPL